MKHILFIIALLCCNTADAQIDFSKKWKGQYVFTSEIPMTSCNIAGRTDYPVVMRTSLAGQKFLVIDTTGKYVVIMIKNYTNGSTNMYAYNYKGTPEEYKNINETNRLLGDYDEDRFYFRIAQADLVNYAEKDEITKGSIAIGVINYPFKMRLQSGRVDFSGAFNFGAAVGYTFKHRTSSKWTYSAIAGFSLTNLNLDSTSVVRNWDRLRSVNNFTGFSYAAGILVAYDKAQVGLFVGADMLSSINQRQFGWVYQNKPWLSMGIGFAIFSPGKATKEGSGDN